MLISSTNSIAYYNGHKYDSIYNLNEKRKMHGAKRVMLFCLMTAILPTILIIIPLYLRHVVFADVVYPVAESDILAIQEGVSSVFCKSLSLKMNSTFNAFQLQGKPSKSGKIKHIRLKKSMSLPDDTLEYWGFYLLKGSIVKLRVCSRHDGARIMVVRGDKNLDTCNLMKHEKYGAKMDADFKGVKVFYEKPAEVVGLIDITNNDLEDEKDENRAVEDLTSESKNSIDSYMEKTREKKSYFIDKNQKSNDDDDDNHDKFVKTKDNNEDGSDDVPKLRHARSHLREIQEKVEELKKSLEDAPIERPKRSVSPLDSHIKHGGNAMNSTVLGFEGDVSSFETNLLTCYDGKILLSRSFQPSQLCNNIEYLYHSNHMVTEHTVASDGYYYYIFYSDNDFVKNDMHAVFDIYKPTYGFKNSSSGKECINQTVCKFPLQLMGGESVIVEVPTRDGIEHEADDITFLTSICEPRMEIYVIFPILVLILIMSCSFL